MDLSDYYTKTEVDTAISSKADSTTLTTHTGDTSVHVTAEDKTAWNLMPKSKAMDFDQNTQVHKDFVIPLICISNTQVNEYFSGRVFLKSTTAAARQMSIINVYCCKNYEEEKPVFFVDGVFPFSVSRPCTFTYNSKKWFGLRVYATSDFNITRIDARTTTDLSIIQQIYYYNNNTATVINSEINDSLVYASNDNDVQIDGYNTPLSFFTTPRVLGTKSRPTAYLLTFSPAPAAS